MRKHGEILLPWLTYLMSGGPGCVLGTGDTELKTRFLLPKNLISKRQ